MPQRPKVHNAGAPPPSPRAENAPTVLIPPVRWTTSAAPGPPQRSGVVQPRRTEASIPPVRFPQAAGARPQRVPSAARQDTPGNAIPPVRIAGTKQPVQPKLAGAGPPPRPAAPIPPVRLPGASGGSQRHRTSLAAGTPVTSTGHPSTPREASFRPHHQVTGAVPGDKGRLHVLSTRAASAVVPIQAQPAGVGPGRGPVPGLASRPSTVAAHGAILPARTLGASAGQRSPEPILPGTRAAPGMLLPRSSTIQRIPVSYRTSTSGQPYEPSVLNFVQKLDALVQEARSVALNWPAFANENGYLGLWHGTASSFFGNPHPYLLPPFFHARFGYAIETIASKQLNSVEYGLTVSLQVNAGMTRPDIVLVLAPYGEVAWIDITASNDTGHIKKKGGTGWTTRPFVYEITYPSLDPIEIMQGMNNPVMQQVGAFSAHKLEIRQDALENVMDMITEEVVDIQNQLGFNTPYGNQQKKMKETKQEFVGTFGNVWGSNINQSVKSAISQTVGNPGHFGFKSGKEDSTAFRNFTKQQAQYEIDIEEGELRKRELTQQQSFFAKFSTPQVHQYRQVATTPDEEEAKLKMGYALQKVEEYCWQLRNIQGALSWSSRYAPYAGHMPATITQHLLQLPDSYDFNACSAWVAKAQNIVDWWNSLRESVG